MSTTLPTWKEKSSFEKLLTSFSVLLSIVIIILATMQFLGTQPYAILVFEPLMGILMLIQALQYKNYSKSYTMMSVGTAIVLFAATLFIYMTR